MGSPELPAMTIAHAALARPLIQDEKHDPST